MIRTATAKVYIVLEYVDLGSHVLSVWSTKEEADNEMERVYQADRAKNRHVERRYYDVEEHDVMMISAVDAEN